MGYACPVCDAEQADGVHLANHLAVTASLGRSDHEGWLETHAPDWRDCGPEELAERVVEYAPEIEMPEFDDAGHAPDLETELAAQGRRPGRGSMSADVDDVLAQARELTRQMYDESDGEPEDTGSRPDDDASDGPDGTNDEPDDDASHRSDEARTESTGDDTDVETADEAETE